MQALPNEETAYWKHNFLRTIYPTIQGDLKVDVVVIDAGIAGLTVAYWLKMD